MHTPTTPIHAHLHSLNSCPLTQAWQKCLCDSFLGSKSHLRFRSLTVTPSAELSALRTEHGSFNPFNVPQQTAWQWPGFHELTASCGIGRSSLRIISGRLHVWLEDVTLCVTTLSSMIPGSCYRVLTDWLRGEGKKKRERAAGKKAECAHYPPKAPQEQFHLQQNGVRKYIIVSLSPTETENWGISCKVFKKKKKKKAWSSHYTTTNYARHTHSRGKKNTTVKVTWFTNNDPLDQFTFANFPRGQNLHVEAEPIQTTWAKQALSFCITASTWRKGATFFSITVILYVTSTYQYSR